MTKERQSVSHPWVIPRLEWEKSVAKGDYWCYLYILAVKPAILRVIISLLISFPQEQFESLWHPKSHRLVKLLLDSYALLHESSRYVSHVHMSPEMKKAGI